MSDLYAMGVTECDNMLMLVGVSTKMSEKERDIVMPLIMRGFKVNKIYFVTFHFYLKLTMFYFLFCSFRIVPWKLVLMLQVVRQ